MTRKLPAGIPIKKLPGIYRKALEGMSDATIAYIMAYLQRPLQDSVESAEFVAFVDPFNEENPRLWLYLTGSNTRISSDDERLYAGRSVEFVGDFSALPWIELEEYPDVDFACMLTELITQWFAECWWKAGGWFYSVPAKIGGDEAHGALVDVVELTKKR